MSAVSSDTEKPCRYTTNSSNGLRLSPLMLPLSDQLSASVNLLPQNMETALRFVLVRVCAVYNSQSAVTAVANAVIHAREQWDVAVLSSVLSRRSLEPCWRYSRGGNVCGHVDICMCLLGAPGSWPTATSASWDLVRSCKQRSTG